MRDGSIEIPSSTAASDIIMRQYLLELQKVAISVSAVSRVSRSSLGKT